jgi:hypothetical protein
MIARMKSRWAGTFVAPAASHQFRERAAQGVLMRTSRIESKDTGNAGFRAACVRATLKKLGAGVIIGFVLKGLVTTSLLAMTVMELSAR